MMLFYVYLDSCLSIAAAYVYFYVYVWQHLENWQNGTWMCTFEFRLAFVAEYSLICMYVFDKISHTHKHDTFVSTLEFCLAPAADYMWLQFLFEIYNIPKHDTIVCTLGFCLAPAAGSTWFLFMYVRNIGYSQQT